MLVAAATSAVGVIDARTGRVLQIIDTPGTFAYTATFVFAGGVSAVVVPGASLTAYALATGARLWSYAAPSGDSFSDAAYANGVVTAEYSTVRRMAESVVRADPEGRSVPWMGLDAFLPVPDAETFAAAARDWLGELPGLLAPDEWEKVLRNEKPPFTGKPHMLWPGYDEWVEPFTVWAEMVVAPLKWNGMRIWHRRVTRTSLEWLSEVLADRKHAVGE